MIPSIVFLVFPLCLTLAALTDLLEMTIPNRIPLVLAAAFIAVVPFTDLGWHEFGLHVAAALAVFAVCFSLFALNVMGGGDAKLLTAAALWFGLNGALVEFLLYVAYLGGVLTILILVIRANASTVMATGLRLPHSLLMAKKVPYGIAIGASGLLAFPQSPIVLWALQQA